VISSRRARRRIANGWSGASRASAMRRARPWPVRRRIAPHAPADTIICNGAGNFSGWFHRFWHIPGRFCQLAPTNGQWAIGLPAAWRRRCAIPTSQALCVAGDGDFPDEWQELATARRTAPTSRAGDRQWQATAPSACTRSGTIPRG
jgi:thiamine pyrophosphate-dependent acetolactate synthase large subunit-like protein